MDKTCYFCLTSASLAPSSSRRRQSISTSIASPYLREREAAFFIGLRMEAQTIGTPSQRDDDQSR